MSTRSVIARPVTREGGASGFTGVYHHWDGYPSGVGASLFAYRNGFFGGDTEAMLRYLVDEHPAGWSTINGKDLGRKPGFHEGMDGDDQPCTVAVTTSAIEVDGPRCGRPSKDHLCQTFGADAHAAVGFPYPCREGHYGYHLGHEHKPDPAAVADARLVPECYCHGDRTEDAEPITEANASGAGCEYAYVLDGSKMTILSSYTDIGSDEGVKDQKMIGFFGMGDKNAEWRPIATIDLDGPEPDWKTIEA